MTSDGTANPKPHITESGKPEWQPVRREDFRGLYIPPQDSHKGQNGRLLVIGGSHLFHAASLWALTVASRIVDLVHYCSVDENNQIVQHAKEEFRNGIVVPRNDVESYIEEDDVVLIGPGMTRDKETEELTNRLLKKYPQKQWVIDAGSLQMMDIALIPKHAILTPHHGEFEHAFGAELRSEQFFFDPLLASTDRSQSSDVTKEGSGADVFTAKLEKRSSKNLSLTAQQDAVRFVSQKHECIVLLKGQIDIACDGKGMCRVIQGGNAGMTKGGTGDVLAGLIAALACKSDPFLATIAGSYINKKAGDELYEKVGPYFNATDLANEIPRTMKRLLL